MFSLVELIENKATVHTGIQKMDCCNNFMKEVLYNKSNTCTYHFPH